METRLTIIGIVGVALGALLVSFVVRLCNRRARLKRWMIAAALMGMPVVYVLLGPVISALNRNGRLPPSVVLIITDCYLPFRWCYNHSPRFAQTSFWYYKLQWSEPEPTWQDAEREVNNYPYFPL